MTFNHTLTSQQCSEAFVTLVTSDSYVVGALVLGYSLKSVESSRRLICMVTTSLAADSIAALREIYEVRFVDPLNSGDERNLALLGRPELGPTFTKLQLWSFTDLSKVVFLDADMIILKNIDELFEREEMSACADVGWPDCFNSGLFVAVPSIETYNSLIAFAFSQGSFDGGDQGLLNSYFSSWATGPSNRRIPFVFNLTFNACYSYLPAFERNKDQVRVVHFIGTNKPWTFNRFSDGKVAARGDGANVHLEFVQKWWDIHDLYVRPKADSPQPPSFMSLYNGSGFRLAVQQPTHHRGEYSHTPTTRPMSQDFANYRIKWTDDVESFFQKKHLSKMPSRKLVEASEQSEDDFNQYCEEEDGSDTRPPIRKPSAVTTLPR